MYEIKLVTSQAAFLALEKPWKALVDTNREAHIFQTFEWNSTWWQHLGHPYHLHIVVVEQHAEIVCIAPLMWSRKHLGPLQWRKFEFIGKRVSNYHDFILRHSPQTREVVSLLVEHLHTQLTGCDYVVLRLLSDDSPTPELLQQAVRARALPGRFEPDATSYLVDLKGSWQEYSRTKISADFRRDTERRIRRLTEDGTLRCVECSDAESVGQALSALFSMKIAQRRALGERSFYEDRDFQAFDRAMAGILLQNDWLFTHMLTLDGTPIAVNFDLKFKRRVYLHEIAYDADFGRKYSPGRVLQYFEIEKVFGLGMTEFDFAWDDLFYKRQWCNRERHTHKLYLFRHEYLWHRWYLGHLRPWLKHIYRTYCSAAMRQKIKKILRLDP